MGANTRNRYGISRRFSVCYQLAEDAIYRELIDNYQVSKLTAQNGLQEHLEHVRNIQALRDYISKQPINHN